MQQEYKTTTFKKNGNKWRKIMINNNINNKIKVNNNKKNNE